MSEVELTRNGERVQLVFEEDLGSFWWTADPEAFGLRVPALVETMAPVRRGGRRPDAR